LRAELTAKGVHCASVAGIHLGRAARLTCGYRQRTVRDEGDLELRLQGAAVLCTPVALGTRRSGKQRSPVADASPRNGLQITRALGDARLGPIILREAEVHTVPLGPKSVVIVCTVAPLVGLADLIGMAVHGCGAPTTALSLPVWRSVLSSPLPPLVPSHRVHIPTCVGIGPIRRGTEGIGIIADLQVVEEQTGPYHHLVAS